MSTSALTDDDTVVLLGLIGIIERLISGGDVPTPLIQAVHHTLEQGNLILRGADRHEVDQALALMVQKLHRTMSD